MSENAAERQGHKNDKDEALARALGWFSLALGLAGTGAPHSVSKSIGVRDHPLVMRGVGLREIACGLGLLSQERPAPWLWARVGGDLMDLGLLSAALVTESAKRRPRTAAATAAVTAITAVDLYAARRMSAKDGSHAKNGSHEPPPTEARD
jgi:hypothetical protein